MPTKICPNCKQIFQGEDEICESCKFIRDKKIEQMEDLVGAVEMLAILRGAKNKNNKDTP